MVQPEFLQIVHVINRTQVRMRVWERGAGITRACGSGACATAVAAILRGLCDYEVNVWLDGGELSIRWDRDQSGDVWMTGPVATSFVGTIHPSLLESVHAN